MARYGSHQIGFGNSSGTLWLPSNKFWGFQILIFGDPLESVFFELKENYKQKSKPTCSIIGPKSSKNRSKNHPKSSQNQLGRLRAANGGLEEVCKRFTMTIEFSKMATLHGFSYSFYILYLYGYIKMMRYRTYIFDGPPVQNGNF